MYDDHYGFTGRPFQLTPDPHFWFDTATHRKAMAYLGYGLSQGEGFIVITGDPGAGKTTLLGHLLATVDRERLHVLRIGSTQIEPDDLLRIVAEQYGIETRGLTKSELLGQIERAVHATARAGKRSLLVVDEAQALPLGSLEELRMLSNLQAGGHALMQIFLLGQPEFRNRLADGQRLEQLRQRVIAMHHLEPMGADEVGPYMIHRMKLVGWSGTPSFTDDAFAVLHRASRGLPRELNQLAARVLLYGAIERLDRIDARVVEAVIADLAEDIPQSGYDLWQPQGRRAAATSTLPPAVEQAFAEVAKQVDAAAVAEPVPATIELPAEVATVDVEPQVEAAVAEPAEVPAVPAIDDGVIADLHARIAGLEARVEEQDAALRRVLTLLVDWVEGEGQRPDIASLRTRAA